MGYTHYWKATKPFTDEAWKLFVEDVKKIFAELDVPLGNWMGEEGSKPTIDDDEVGFNGVGEWSHETCVIYKKSEDFGFCKTARKPYDSVVVEVLKAARNRNSSFELSSDGGPEVFDDPEPRTVMGYPMD